MSYSNSVSHPKYRYVALIMPIGAACHGEVAQAFLRYSHTFLDKGLLVHPYYSAGMDELFIENMVLNALEEPYEAIVTIGLRCTNVVKKVLKERELNIPHVFIGITDPYKEQVLSKNNKELITGVRYEDNDYEKLGLFLRDLKKNVNRILLPVNICRVEKKKAWGDNDWIYEKIDVLHQLFACNRISFTAKEFYSLTAVDEYVVSNFSEFDVIMLLEGTLSLELHKEFTHICSQYGVTLFSGSQEAVAYGSAAGYGTHFAPLGRAGVELVRRILFNQENPSNIEPVTIQLERKPAVNLAVAERQGLDPVHAEKICHEWDGIIYTTAECDDSVYSPSSS